MADIITYPLARRDLKGEPMSIGKAIKMVIDEYMRVKDYENIEKPISWALYQTWKIVDSKEKRRRADDTDNK